MRLLKDLETCEVFSLLDKSEKLSPWRGHSMLQAEGAYSVLPVE